MQAAREEDDSNPFLFPGNAEDKPLQDIKKFWARICRDAKLADLRLHDLRHTFASQLVSSGIPLAVVARLLGHTQAATTHRYAHLADEPLRDATDRFGTKLENLSRGKRPRWSRSENPAEPRSIKAA